jgi:hypothetical protein
MGDGILTYFGYPRAHEDDAEQAVRAGLALIDALRRLQAPEPLKVRVGIDTGLVVVGDLIGSGESQERGIVGETPNLAARLQAVAAPNTVVISPKTHRLLAELFEYQDLGSIEVKGFAKPVHAYQVLRPSAVESRFEALHTTATPLVGRDEQIEILMRCWQQAKKGDGSVVLISGEPGIGKSRITQAIQDGLSTDLHTRLRYFCSAHHQDSALYPIIGQLERAAGFQRDETNEQRLIKLESLLARATNDWRGPVPLLAELLSIPTGQRYPALNLVPQKRKENTFNAFLAQLEGLAASQPVLMLFEDVHWMDPTSLELIALIVDRVAHLQVLLLITARPEFTPPWPDRTHITKLALTRFSRREGAALVELVTSGKALPEEVMNQILAHTDGVPLFVEELTKMVLESGLLEERSGNYVLERPLPPLANGRCHWS